MSALNGTAFFAYPSVSSISSGSSAVPDPSPAHDADAAGTPYLAPPAPEGVITPAGTHATAQLQAPPSHGPSTSRRRAPSLASPSRSCSPPSPRSNRRASKIPRVAGDVWAARPAPSPGADPATATGAEADAMMVDSPHVTASTSVQGTAWSGPEASAAIAGRTHTASTTTAPKPTDAASSSSSSGPQSVTSQGSSDPASAGSGGPNRSEPHPSPSGDPARGPDGGGAGASRRVVPATLAEAELEDVLVMVADMLTRLLEHNDSLPAPSSGGDKKWGSTGGLTRFHSRVVPGISVQDYLVRMARYTSLEKVCVLLVLVYIDRIAAAQAPPAPDATSASSGPGAVPGSGVDTPRSGSCGADPEAGGAFAHLPSTEPRFTLCSLTVHRFVCAAIVCSSKALCDSFATNAHYAKVGGISLQELNVLERELLRLIRWRLVSSPELLEQYYRSLVAAHPNYVLAEQAYGDALDGPRP